MRTYIILAFLVSATLASPIKEDGADRRDTDAIDEMISLIQNRPKGTTLSHAQQARAVKVLKSCPQRK